MGANRQIAKSTNRPVRNLRTDIRISRNNVIRTITMFLCTNGNWLDASRSSIQSLDESMSPCEFEKRGVPCQIEMRQKWKTIFKKSLLRASPTQLGRGVDNLSPGWLWGNFKKAQITPCFKHRCVFTVLFRFVSPCLDRTCPQPGLCF